MAKIRVFDEAHLLRLEIEGRFAGALVNQVRESWQAVLQEASSRRFTVDISQLTGYDLAGSELLREMCKHGTYVAARNPRALVFLHEISQPENKRSKLHEVPSTKPKAGSELKRPNVRAAAAGE